VLSLVNQLPIEIPIGATRRADRVGRSAPSVNGGESLESILGSECIFKVTKKTLAYLKIVWKLRHARFWIGFPIPHVSNVVVIMN